MLLVGATSYALATHGDFSLVGAASLSVPGYPFTPAQAGETIVVFGVGFGLPGTSLVSGSSSQSGTLPFTPIFQVGGKPAACTYAGLISPGLYQFNVTIPATAASGDNAITATYSGLATPSGRLVTVK